MRKFLKRLLDWLACLVAVGGVMTGCADSSPTDVLAIRATGIVAGLAFIDRDDSGALEPTIDGPLAGLRIALVLPASSDTVARAVTASDGGFVMLEIPVGKYQLLVDTISVGDSLRFTSAIRDTLTVAANDTILSTITATYPIRSIAQARQLPPGRRIFVTGIVVSGWNAFGDSTLHIVSGSSAIRATRVAPTTAGEGDSVKVLAKTGVRDGQPALLDAAVTILGSTALPAPAKTTTALAASALGGTRDAAPVHIDDAVILTATVTATSDLLLTVNDGSGRVEVLLDNAAPVVFAPYVPGAILSATGVLVPIPGSGTWRIKPRSEQDLSVRFPRVTVADARGLAAGKRVAIDAVALNGWATFSDGTIHLADQTGALRAFYTGSLGIYKADSVRFVGTLAFRDGEPALIDVTPTMLGSPATLPAPRATSTAVAARADAGKLDAALVRVTNATVADTATVPSGFRLTVNDSTGVLTVHLDPAAGFTRGLYLPGKVLELVGLLVPHDFGGTWQLRPRAKSDVTTIK